MELNPIVRNPQQDIVQLMDLYGQEVKPAPGIPDQATLLLRARLLFEEAMEFVQAAGCTLVLDGEDIDVDCLKVVGGPSRPALVEMADAIGDVLVVTYGAANALGVDAQLVWNEIQRSNMSKRWAHCSKCDVELETTTPDHGKSWNVSHPDGGCKQGSFSSSPKIHKREDGKVIKAPTYSPANIAAVLAKQTDDYLQNLEHTYGFGILTASQCIEIVKNIHIGGCCTTVGFTLPKPEDPSE